MTVHLEQRHHVIVVALVGLDIYQRVSVDPVYEQSELRHRIFWHNVGIGFSLNPELANKYALYVDDLPMIQLVRRRLVETGRGDQLTDALERVLRESPRRQRAMGGAARHKVVAEFDLERTSRELLGVFAEWLG